MCHDPMMKTDFQDTTGGDPGLFSPSRVAHAPGDRLRSCAKALGAALVILLLAGCELPSSFEELTKVFDGETQDTQTEAGQEDTEPAPEGADAAGAQDASSGSDDGGEGRPSRETVLTAQTLLAGLGYEPGPLDGMDGPQTRAAVRRYQADAEIPVDGRITEALVEKLSDTDQAETNDGGDVSSTNKALPHYVPGDTFVYSDGRVETVAEVEDDRVRWRSNDGSVTTAFSDFVLPAIRRETTLLSEETTVDIEPGALWPLKAGREISFSAKTEVTHKFSPGPRGEVLSQWQCLVDPPQAVSVEAGTFDALRVSCRNTEASSQGPSQRVWYYAPRMRHVIRLEETFENPALDSVVELVAVRPDGKSWPPAAWAGLGWAFQQALDTKTEAESIEWRSTGVDAEVTIRPTTAMNVDASPYCRTFEQTLRRAEDQRIYPGKACRSPSGSWLIPGLESIPQDAKS